MFSDAPSCGFMAPEFKAGSETWTPIRLWTDGGVKINFNQLMRTVAFAVTRLSISGAETLATDPALALSQRRIACET